MSPLVRGACIVAVLWVSNVHADQWLPPQPFERAFYGGLIRVNVNPPLKADARAFVEVNRKKGDALIKLCSGELLNEKRPVDVLVSEDGGMLVTIDDWQHIGYQHSLVFYRCEKKPVLQKDYGIDDFLSPTEVQKYAPMSFSSRHWSKNVEFKMEKDRLAVKLKAGRVIYFSLQDGKILRK